MPGKVTPVPRRASKGRGTHSARRTKTPRISSKDKPKPYKCPWAGCVEACGRRQEWGKHILSTHLPACYCCPLPDCRSRFHRKDKLKKHIEGEDPEYILRLEFEEKHIIYDTKLILGWIRKGIPLEEVATFAHGFAKERMKELRKEKAWVVPCCEKEMCNV